MTSIPYVHLDVFSRKPFSGNSLPVFTDARGLRSEQMLRITQELRHFEAVFLSPTAEIDHYRARVFDLFTELPFAGHPLIGAASALHLLSGQGHPRRWQLDMASRTVMITTSRTPTGFFGLLDQGPAEFLGVVTDREIFAGAFGLAVEDLDPGLPLEVVSTGLRYLIVPVRPDVLQRARIRQDLTASLHQVGAEFAVLLDEAGLEVRHWNNDGIMEDIATGSAAGTLGAYRLRHALVRAGELFVLNQGRFVGRPSRLQVRAEGGPQMVTNVSVGGDVAVVGRGVLETRP